jgi:hypothetical protein
LLNICGAKQEARIKQEARTRKGQNKTPSIGILERKTQTEEAFGQLRFEIGVAPYCLAPALLRKNNYFPPDVSSAFFECSWLNI